MVGRGSGENATVRYLYNRPHTYQLQQDNYDQEENTIHNILHNNSFPIKPHSHPKKRALTQTQDNTTPQKQKWATFTYIGKKTTRITNLFKHTNIKIAFHTNNTVQKLLTHNCYTKDKYSASGIYKLTCPKCNKAYVGQTGRSISQRYLDHQSLGFTLHLAEHQHPFGPINEIMQCSCKGQILWNLLNLLFFFDPFTCFILFNWIIPFRWFDYLNFLVCILCAFLMFSSCYYYWIFGSPQPTVCKLVFFHSHLASGLHLWKFPLASMHLHFFVWRQPKLHVVPHPRTP